MTIMKKQDVDRLLLQILEQQQQWMNLIADLDDDLDLMYPAAAAEDADTNDSNCMVIAAAAAIHSVDDGGYLRR
jgi:hypothetical protein